MKYAVYAAALACLAAMLAACAGFDLGDLVKVRTPNEVQQWEGLPASVSLNDAEVQYEAWYQDVARVGAEWKARIERSSEIRGLLGQLTLGAMQDVGPTLAGVPVVGPALPAATGLIGLFLGSGRLRREKEASFNKGLSEGEKIRAQRTG